MYNSHEYSSNKWKLLPTHPFQYELKRKEEIYSFFVNFQDFKQNLFGFSHTSDPNILKMGNNLPILPKIPGVSLLFPYHRVANHNVEGWEIFLELQLEISDLS